MRVNKFFKETFLERIIILVIQKNKKIFINCKRGRSSPSAYFKLTGDLKCQEQKTK